MKVDFAESENGTRAIKRDPVHRCGAVSLNVFLKPRDALTPSRIHGAFWRGAHLFCRSINQPELRCTALLLRPKLSRTQPLAP